MTDRLTADSAQRAPPVSQKLVTIDGTQMHVNVFKKNIKRNFRF